MVPENQSNLVDLNIYPIHLKNFVFSSCLARSRLRRSSKRLVVGLFFLLVAAWVSPGRSALQSAEHWCQRRYCQIHRDVHH